jgi:hypothetical protein
VFSIYYLPLAAGVVFRTPDTDTLIVARVIAGSGADRANVRPGDRLDGLAVSKLLPFQ